MTCTLKVVINFYPQDSMRKEISRLFKQAHGPEGTVPENIKKVFSKSKACYVLITCEEPSDEGKIQVEMTYEGDATLAAYLIESAREHIDEEDDIDELSL